MDKEDFDALIAGRLPTDSSLFQDLESKQLAVANEVELAVHLAAVKLRSRKAFLKEFTSLHMVVLTRACDCRCNYCQASSLAPESGEHHMSKATAARVVETILQTPAPAIKIEFQGGEPTLNRDTLEYFVKLTNKLNRKFHNKQIEFIVCSNLAHLNNRLLSFFKRHNITISTSLDGPGELHDANRICRDGDSSYRRFQENLTRARQILGHDSCSPLPTITRSNLNHLKEVVDEYVRSGFNGIFLRPVNPYGFARDQWQTLSFPIEDFIAAYKETLDYIIRLNLSGVNFVEYYAQLLLTRILTPFSTGFVDLQSPSGAGISGVIYDVNGDVYPTDEARMLAAAGDRTFLMGNVHHTAYEDIFDNKLTRRLVAHSILDCLPGCDTCVYNPYCGADPVRYYQECGDIEGFRPTSEFCKKNKALFDHLFSLIIENSPDIMNVFWSWITGLSIEEVSL